MAVVRVNGIDVWHEFRGPEDAPLLVLTHGFAGPSEGWPPIIDQVTARLRVLFYDVRGHGKTSVPDASTFSIPQAASIV